MELPEDHIAVLTIGQHRYIDAARGVNDLRKCGEVYPMHKDRVVANIARGFVVIPRHASLDWWNEEGRILAAEPCDAKPYASIPNDDSLRIASGCAYDPGSAAFRLHTAINEHTQHSSVFVRWEDTNPHCSLRQYDAKLDAHIARQSVEEADVIHNHVAYFMLNNLDYAWKSHQLIARHYHGSRRDGKTHYEPKFDMVRGAHIFAARPQLVEEGLKLGAKVRWSPIPMPVDRYKAIRDKVTSDKDWVPFRTATAARPMRIAHSPTNEEYKGTAALRQAVSGLQSRGVNVVLHLIKDMNLSDALVHKARADVMFDSFWLGIQGSGLEAASMGIPVIAGDREAQSATFDYSGHYPYAFADDANELEEQLYRMSYDVEYREHVADRGNKYVKMIHDYRNVAYRYERDLSQILGRDVTTPKEAELVAV